jgi:RraA family protein
MDEAWSELAAATVADNVDAARVLGPGLVHLAGPTRAVGPAFTVRAGPGGFGAVRAALAAAPSGAVLVLAGEGEPGKAIWGEVSTVIALGRGIAGVIVDGAVRDLEALRADRLPVFARGTTPRGPDRELTGEIEVPIECAGATVAPGDLIIADPDGIVVVPEAAIEAGLAAALAGAEHERDRLAEVGAAADRQL